MGVSSTVEFLALDRVDDELLGRRPKKVEAMLADCTEQNTNVGDRRSRWDQVAEDLNAVWGPDGI